MRDSCLFCTWKHLDTARSANIEMMLGHPENNKGVVGELVHAAQEVYEYSPELSLRIREVWKKFEESLWRADIVKDIESAMNEVELLATAEAADGNITLSGTEIIDGDTLP